MTVQEKWEAFKKEQNLPEMIYPGDGVAEKIMEALAEHPDEKEVGTLKDLLLHLLAASRATGKFGGACDAAMTRLASMLAKQESGVSGETEYEYEIITGRQKVDGVEIYLKEIRVDVIPDVAEEITQLKNAVHGWLRAMPKCQKELKSFEELENA